MCDELFQFLLQVNWNLCSVAENFSAQAEEAVDALFHRFGVLASQAWPLEVMDDQGSIEQSSSSSSSSTTATNALPTSSLGHTRSSAAGASAAAAHTVTLVRMNRICIRRFVNVFLAFYRLIYLWRNRTEVTSSQDAGSDFDCGIRIHHIVAASDDFSKLSMHWDLMPAARLNYVHDFRGYFNCISQVIYFHNPEYERRPQVRSHLLFQCFFKDQ